MASRKLEDLYEPLRAVLEDALEEAKEKGLDILVTCTHRSPKEQEALYAQGREGILSVNKKREAVGLVRIKQAANRKITWTLKSYHTSEPKSMAFDFAIGTSGKVFWDLKVDVNDNDIPDYQEFAEICKSKNPNIQWGGDFKTTKDCPHVQWKNGMTINQNEVIEVPEVPVEVVEMEEEGEKEKEEGVKEAKVEEKVEQQEKPRGGFLQCLRKVKDSILQSFRKS
jgi:peptidoglycan L-alanyl-D-glutamate endopeptidase CwlK